MCCNICYHVPAFNRPLIFGKSFRQETYSYSVAKFCQYMKRWKYFNFNLLFPPNPLHSGWHFRRSGLKLCLWVKLYVDTDYLLSISFILWIPINSTYLCRHSDNVLCCVHPHHHPRPRPGLRHPLPGLEEEEGEGGEEESVQDQAQGDGKQLHILIFSTFMWRSWFWFRITSNQTSITFHQRKKLTASRNIFTNIFLKQGKLGLLAAMSNLGKRKQASFPQLVLTWVLLITIIAQSK